VIWSLARENQRLGLNVSVAGLEDEFVQVDCAGHNVKFITGAVIGPGAMGFSPELRTRLRAQTGPGSIIHCHGLWMHPGMVARRAAESSGSRLVISPHGMLEPWALGNSRWKKWLAGRLFENRNLRSAGCLHALCEAEACNIRSYGLQNPIAVIPNGVDLEDFICLPAYEAIERDYTALIGKKRMLFLSRIHPKKGLSHLIRAWHRVAPAFKDWVLLVAGKGQLGHEAELKVLVSELGLSDSVLFLGPLYGEAKGRVLAGADAFTLPSFSEGLSMAVLEAAACALPVLLTPQCNFPELVAARAALEVQPNVEDCERGLRRMLSFPRQELREMGLRGRGLIRRVYTWPDIADRMAAVYAWLLDGGPRPDCVHVD